MFFEVGLFRGVDRIDRVTANCQHKHVTGCPLGLQQSRPAFFYLKTANRLAKADEFQLPIDRVWVFPNGHFLMIRDSRDFQ
jgi:hypothetical protein